MKDHQFHEMLQSIDQARDIHRGHRKPGRVFVYDGPKVKQIRAKAELSQRQFARLICVSLDTLQNWEQGRTSPKGAALALLRVAEANPQLVLQALHFVKGKRSRGRKKSK